MNTTKTETQFPLQESIYNEKKDKISNAITKDLLEKYKPKEIYIIDKVRNLSDQRKAG